MLQQGGSSEGRWEAETERRQPTLVGFLLLLLTLGPGLSWMVLLTLTGGGWGGMSSIAVLHDSPFR